MRPLLFVVTALTGAALLAACSGGDAGVQSLRAPEHGPVPAPPELADDPSTEAKIALGTEIFFDTRLSGSGHSSCNSCHLYLTSFQDNLPGSASDAIYPLDAPALARNTPSFLNMVYAPVFRWDGSHTDMVEVLSFPFAEPNMNLGSDVASAKAKLKERLTVAAPEYVKRYSDAFGVSIETATEQEVWRLTGRALRAFLTKAVSRDAPFDRWNAGDDSAMSEKQKRGYALFEGKARCGACHSGPLFSDFSFHNVSTSPPDSNGSRADEGRYLVTKDPKDRGKFLTPTLRGVSSTLPYFHDGSQAALPNVVRFFASFAVEKDPLRDPAFQSSLALTDDEVSEIVAFLGALQGDDVAATIQPPK